MIQPHLGEALVSAIFIESTGGTRSKYAQAIDVKFTFYFYISATSSCNKNSFNYVPMFWEKSSSEHHKYVVKLLKWCRNIGKIIKMFFFFCIVAMSVQHFSPVRFHKILSQCVSNGKSFSTFNTTIFGVSAKDRPKFHHLHWAPLHGTAYTCKPGYLCSCMHNKHQFPVRKYCTGSFLNEPVVFIVYKTDIWGKTRSLGRFMVNMSVCSPICYRSCHS